MSNNSTSAGFAVPNGDAVAGRLGAVESLLRLVAQMPASDPPPGLVQRTVEHILQHQDGPRVVAPAMQPPVTGQGPQHV